MTQKRLDNLIELLEFDGLNAIALTAGPSLKYLTGLEFHVMERPVALLIAPGAVPALILAELEANRVKNAALPIQPFTYSDVPDTWEKAFQNACQALELNGKLIGVEPARMRYLEFRMLQKAAPQAGFLPADHALSMLRIRKDPEEVAKMREAARIAELALQASLPCVRVGVTEREIASELVMQLLRAGSDHELPFGPIVASGPNTANPHSTPSDRKIQPGDLLLFDWGATYQGYISDITRTYAIGKISREFERIYEVVKQANAVGRAASRPGVQAREVDQAAREVITAAGYGPQFSHRVGHGIGMEAHEPPYMHAGNTMELSEGMAYTVEPGIYLADQGGVRIEDNVVITADGCETLTTLSRELIVLE